MNARAKVAERGAGADSRGLEVFLSLLRLGSLADRATPLLGVEVGRDGERITAAALPNETPAQLFRRACPSGSWRLRARPLFGPPEPMPKA